MQAKRAVCVELRIEPYEPDLSALCAWLDTLPFEPVTSRTGSANAWSAIALRGYKNDPLYVIRPTVLGGGGSYALQNTYLLREPEAEPVRQILDCIPAQKERVRVMRLQGKSVIGKHRDSVDQTIQLHVPLRTSSSVAFEFWHQKNRSAYFHLRRGHFYYVDCTLPHRVINNGYRSRLHLVADCYANKELRKLIPA